MSLPFPKVSTLNCLSRTIIVTLCLCATSLAAEPKFAFERSAGKLTIRLNETQLGDYVFQDEEVSHPYFANVKTVTGQQVTRHHPPRKDVDAPDHVGLHTGIWLSFGDLNGFDYWRLKAKTEHVKFVEEPRSDNGSGSFTVLNRYVTADGKDSVCEETCRYTFNTVPHGYLIDMSSEFRPGKSEMVFGDQEEMGLAIRLETRLAVDRKQGGRILDSSGRLNGAGIWGKTADWCDYSGVANFQWIGMTVLTDPGNFRPCWCHARDYGFLTMNPFGRNAFTKGEPSQVIVKPGETFKLRYGVVVHATTKPNDYEPAEAYKTFVGQAAK